MFKRLTGLLLFVALTLLTRVGGIAFAISWVVSRFLSGVPAGRRVAINIPLFAAFYAALSIAVVPRLAALAGRV